MMMTATMRDRALLHRTRIEGSTLGITMSRTAQPSHRMPLPSAEDWKVLVEGVGPARSPPIELNDMPVSELSKLEYSVWQCPFLAA